MNQTETKIKVNWVTLLNAIIQAAIAALTALGITSCSSLITALA